MGASDIRNNLVNFFSTQWANRTPIVYENEPYDPPKTATWLSLKVVDMFMEPASLGSDPCYRTEGFVHIVINAPENTKTKMSRALTDEIYRIFVRQQIGNITITTFEKKELGFWDDFHKTTIKVYFYADESYSSLTA